MGTFKTWQEAHTEAQKDANLMGRPMALEYAKEYGRGVYRVKMIPCDPSKRFGWEARCEVVEPERRTP